MPDRPIVIAGGGTGGHVYPALAIADALVAAGIPKDEIQFVGSRRGMESTVIPAAGYKVALLRGRGIKRSFSLDNIGAVAGLISGGFHAFAALRRARPRAVVSVGGYAAAPAAAAAVVLRVPLVLVESNAVPGAVNRLASRFARASAVSYPNTPLPNASLTGNPVRSEIIAIKRNAIATAEAKRTLGLATDRVLVAAFGGSLGARTINSAMAQLIDLWKDREDVGVYHVLGKRDWKASLAATPDIALQVTRVEYESRMDLLYTAADVVVSRSGATTSAEIAVAGVPSVLVPLPGAPGDHQTANAIALREAGAAELLIDANCSGQALAMELEPIVTDSDLRTKMSEAAKSLGHPDAATKVAELILRVTTR